MIDFLTAEWKLFSLKRADSRLQKAFRKDRIEAEKEKGSFTRVQEIYQQEAFERSLYLDEIAQIKTHKLYREACRYGVFVSQDEDWWESSHVIGGRQLTAKGFSELRSAIRKEKNERWAYWDLRLKVVLGAITGAAALIGLAAMFKK